MIICLKEEEEEKQKPLFSTRAGKGDLGVKGGIWVYFFSIP
jgi:hypothetical protein